MALSEKLAQLLTLIYDKTKKDEVVWEKTATSNGFQTSFAKYSLMIVRVRDFVPFLQLYNEEGALIEEVNSRGTTATEDDTLTRLYERARRQALGVDRAVDEILAELKTEKKG